MRVDELQPFLHRGQGLADLLPAGGWIVEFMIRKSVAPSHISVANRPLRNQTRCQLCKWYVCHRLLAWHDNWQTSPRLRELLYEQSDRSQTTTDMTLQVTPKIGEKLAIVVRRLHPHAAGSSTNSIADLPPHRHGTRTALLASSPILRLGCCRSLSRLLPWTALPCSGSRLHQAPAEAPTRLEHRFRGSVRR